MKIFQESGFNSDFDNFIESLEELYKLSSSFIFKNIDILNQFNTVKILLGHGLSDDIQIDVYIKAKCLKIISNLCDSEEFSKFFLSLEIIPTIGQFLIHSEPKVIVNLLRILINIVSTNPLRFSQLILDQLTLEPIIIVLSVHYTNPKIYKHITQLLYLLSFADTSNFFPDFFKAIVFSLSKISNQVDNYWIFWIVPSLIRSTSMAHALIASSIFVNFLTEALHTKNNELIEPILKIISSIYYYTDHFIENFDYDSLIQLLLDPDESIVMLTADAISNIMTSEAMTDFMIQREVMKPLVLRYDDGTFDMRYNIEEAIGNATQTASIDSLIQILHEGALGIMIKALDIEDDEIRKKALTAIKILLSIEGFDDFIATEFNEFYSLDTFNEICAMENQEIAEFAEELATTYPQYFGTQ
ncbi:hypothetical protein GPJ56_010126 [Histomonas meleagridis]|uniref:uncharacterized protein n=1 Tax=Histomonas meleagridis TaxID=135588 RepID=UPI00355A5CFF|nr:hypothetical protein GPJ56_010126 [Histomonas meleagridis]KAH0806783.1 hypothetical protein GO595_000426 [Histomonas meleagridis]